MLERSANAETADPALERELNDRLAEFANCWNKLMRGMAKGVWNAKEAAKARKSFQRLVKSRAWIEDGKASGTAPPDAEQQ